jgi:hypothetical protein
MIIEPSRTESFDLVGVNPELFAAVLSLLQDDESPVNVPRTRLAAAGSGSIAEHQKRARAAIGYTHFDVQRVRFL